MMMKLKKNVRRIFRRREDRRADKILVSFNFFAPR